MKKQSNHVLNHDCFVAFTHPHPLINLKRMLPTTSDGGRDCCTDCGTRNGDRNVKNDLTQESVSAAVEGAEDGFSFTWKDRKGLDLLHPLK